MNWKKRHRSFYYKYADDPEDIVLKSNETAHLIIDVQKTYLSQMSEHKLANQVSQQSLKDNFSQYHLPLLRLDKFPNLLKV